jgi:hypothetical protein
VVSAAPVSDGFSFLLIGTMIIFEIRKLRNANYLTSISTDAAASVSSSTKM